MAASDRISINSEPYEIADPSKIKTGRRTYIETQRPSQPFETTPQVYSWAPWGPLGNSRQRLGGPLSTDYTIDLDGRNFALLTSAAKRNAVSLTALTEFSYGVPISDVSKVNWTEGAGNGNGDAFDELDDGVVAGPADDATTFWISGGGLGFGNRLDCNLTSLTDPGVNTGHTMRIRYLHTGATENLFLTLSQAGVAKYTAFQQSHTGDWETWEVAIPESTAATITDYTDLELKIQQTTGTGTTSVTGMELEIPAATFGNVIALEEQFGFLYAIRGAFSTQLDMSTATEIENNSRNNRITDVAQWRGIGIQARGDQAVVSTRTAATSAGSTYSTITGVDATHLAVGADRLWLMDAGLTTAADKGKAKFSVDALSSASLSNAVQVVDPETTVTGLYAHGEYLFAGQERGFNSFTNSGKPSRLMESVIDFPSSANAARHTTIWGWEYVATQLGLFAISIDPRIENPVGPGEGLEGQRFEGPIDGYPTAVRAFKDSLWVSYLNPDGDSYLLRGVFNQQITPGSGRPDWFIFRKLPSLTCEAIGATTGRTVPAVVWGEDQDIAYADLSTRGREIEDSNYVFDTGGGQWFGTTLMMPIGVRGNVRWAKLFTENCVASTDTWQVAVDVDDASSYIDVGSAITANGAQTVRPVSAGVPLTTVSFTSLKPRLTQVASSETAPPQIRGELAIGVDARPDMVREVDVLLDLEKQSQLTDLQALIGDTQQPPVKMRLPTDQGVNADKYGHVISADWYDRSDPTDNVALVKLREWEIS